MKNAIILLLLAVAVLTFCWAQTPAAPENVMIISESNNITIIWDPVEDVTGYVIYYRDIPDTSFSFLAYTEDTSYVSNTISQCGMYQVSSYTGNPRQRIIYSLGENENFPAGCNMTIALEPQGHMSYCQV